MSRGGGGGGGGMTKYIADGGFFWCFRGAYKSSGIHAVTYVNGVVIIKKEHTQTHPIYTFKKKKRMLCYTIN